MTFGPLIRSDELAALLPSQDLRLYDASFYLPGEGIDGRERFRTAHLPGARYFDIDAIADVTLPLPHMAPPPPVFERMAEALDLDSRQRVVFYDQRGMYSAARGWWLLRLYGHHRVAVLDGGLAKWVREQRQVQSGDAPPVSGTAHFHAQWYSQRLRGLDAVRDNLRTANELLVDARAAGRFRGETPEPRPGLRSGHIPGARNLPYGELLAADGTMLAPAELRTRLAQAGVGANTQVVASCGSGVSAALILLALAVAGYREGALYDGSWAEWGGRSDTPVAVGAAVLRE